MKKAGRLLTSFPKPVVPGPYITSHGRDERDTPTTDEDAKPETSSSSMTTKEEAPSQDFCDSKTTSERGKEMEAQLKRDAEDSKNVKAESSSSAMKEGEAGKTASAGNVPAIALGEVVRESDQERQDRQDDWLRRFDASP